MPSLSPAAASLVWAQLGLGQEQYSGKGLEVSCSGIKQRHSSLSWISSLVNQSHWWWITPLQLQEFPLLQVNGRTGMILGLSAYVHTQGWCGNHIGIIWEPQPYSGLCVCPARKAGQLEKGVLLSLDGMGDSPTPERLDYLKVPWHISYREPCGRRGWKEANNWCSANFLFKKKKKKCSAVPNPLPLIPTRALWSGSFLPWLDTIPAIYHHLYI